MTKTQKQNLLLTSLIPNERRIIMGSNGNGGNIHQRGIKVAKECHKKIVKMEEEEDFRANVQYRHIRWEHLPTNAVATVTAEVDNVFRNYAYKEKVSPSSGFIKFFNSKEGKKFLKDMKKKYPQRPASSDWKAWRRAIQLKELTPKEKKVDKWARKIFDDAYIKNKPSSFEGVGGCSTGTEG